MRQNLINILGRLEIKQVNTSGYISLFSEFTNPLNGNEIRNKIQETYNVTITYPVFVDINRGGNQRGGRGGGIMGAAQNKPAGSFYVKQNGYRYPPKEQMKDFLPSLID